MTARRLVVIGVLLAIVGITGMYYFQKRNQKPKVEGAFQVGFLPVT